MEKVTLLKIAKAEIPSVLLERLPDPTFIDKDVDLDEKMYYGNVFEEIDQDDLLYSELSELIMLIKFANSCEYVLITNV
ncbi:MAG: hypothetical protein EOL97_16245 [Spirochaetia bacterium]|nr:hypothetical protein [Spirochaetia bacterium]